MLRVSSPRRVLADVKGHIQIPLGGHIQIPLGLWFTSASVYVHFIFSSVLMFQDFLHFQDSKFWPDVFLKFSCPFFGMSIGCCLMLFALRTSTPMTRRTQKWIIRTSAWLRSWKLKYRSVRCRTIRQMCQKVSCQSPVICWFWSLPGEWFVVTILRHHSPLSMAAISTDTLIACQKFNKTASDWACNSQY